MKLQTKITFSILPLVLVSIFILGFWTTQKLNEATKQSNDRYLNNVIDLYLTEHVGRLHSILIENELNSIESFVISYQKNAIKMAKDIAIKESGYIFAMNDRGELIFGQDTSMNESILKSFEQIAIRFADDPKTTLTGHTGDTIYRTGYIYSVRYFEPWDWVVFFAISDDNTHVAERSIRNATLGVALFCVFALVILMLFIFRKLFVHPVKILKRAAISVTEGKHVNKIEIQSLDELGELARSMEKMSGEIQAHKKEQLTWQKTLEDKVDDRTKMLQETNEKLVSEAIERQKAEASLKRFRLIMDQAGESIFILDSNSGTLIDANETACRQLGYDREELLQLRLCDFELNYSSSAAMLEHLEEINSSGDSFMITESSHRRKNGSSFPVEVSISKGAINGQKSFSLITRDITDRKQAEKQIKDALREKETLLQEIHHRVKNNMSVISSLLAFQMNSTNNEKAREALQDSQNRVLSMSMIHETLYRSDNLSAINLKTYLSGLGKNIIQNYFMGNEVRFKVAAENIMIGVKQASPIGLIVNELIVNSLKYAFSDGREGEIFLELKSDNENGIELTVSDNGVGIPDSFDLKNAGSLGLKLVKLLAENQLDGSINMERNNGTKFTIKFNLET